MTTIAWIFRLYSLVVMVFLALLAPAGIMMVKVNAGEVNTIHKVLATEYHWLFPAKLTALVLVYLYPVFLLTLLRTVVHRSTTAAPG